jgi:NADH-quinone oxidoreductase subunit N
MKWITLQDFVIVLPILVLLAVSLIPIMIKVFMGNREPNPLATLIYSFVGLVLAMGLTASLSGANTTAFSNAIVMDGTSVWMSCLVYLLTAAALMLAYDHEATRGRQFSEFNFLTICSAIGMVILIMANDLIITFIGIEMMSLCLYILIAMSREEILSKEASLKYFVLGSFASAIFLYGIALIWGASGTTYLPELAGKVDQLIGTSRVFLAGLGLVILGFAFKVSIFPFHSWTPDVYQGAPTPLTAYMSTAVKAASFIAFLRLFNSQGFAQSEQLLTLLTWLAALTMVVGNVAAIMQDNLKRLLAYSGVAHSGYAMIGLIAAGFGSDFNSGASSVLFYLISYSIMTFGAFALVAVFEKTANTSLNVSDLKGLGRRYPVLGLSLTVLMLSLAGLPPTLGFFGKFYVFAAAVEQDMYWLPFWGVVSSVISVYYYLRPTVVMYMSEADVEEKYPSRLISRMTVIVSAVLIVVLGILASPVFRSVRTQLLITDVKGPAYEVPAEQPGSQYGRFVQGSPGSN